MLQRTTSLPPVVVGIDGSDATGAITMTAQCPVGVSRHPPVSAPAGGNRIPVGIGPAPDNDRVVVTDIVGPHDPAILGHCQCSVLLAR